MDTQRPRSQSVLQHYPPTSQSRTSKFLQKVSNLKVRIRFSSNTNRNSKDIDTPTTTRAAGNGRGSINLFHNPYPSQGHPHNPHRRTPSDDIYTYDSSMKPYMSQPSMLGNMVVEPYVPNSNNQADEGDDADSMHLNDQTPTQTTRRFPFGRHKNSSQKSISQGLLPATSVVVGAAQARPAPRNSRRSADITDGLPSTQTSAQPRIASRLAIDGLPHESHSPVRPPSRQKQVRPSTSPSHSQTQSYSRVSPPRPSHDTHRTTPSIVISDPSESSDSGVFGNTAITQHNSHQEHQEDGQRPRSSLGSGDHTGLGHANPNIATPHAYLPSRSRPSSSRSTASAANSGSLNGYGRRTGSPGRPSSVRSSESERSYVSAVSQLVDALDNGLASDVGHGTSSPFGSPKMTGNVGGSQPPGAMAPQIPGATRNYNEATRPASSVLSGFDERSISPLPPRMESLPAQSSSTNSTPRRPRPPSRPLPPPPTENGDADIAHTLNLPRASVDGEGSSRPSSRMSSTHPTLESFSFPTFTSEPLSSPQSPPFHANDEDSQKSPSSPQRPTLKQRSSSSSLKRVGQAITRKLSIGKLRRDSMGEVEGRRPSISPSLKDAPLPPIPNFPRSSSANAVPSASTVTRKPADDDTPKPTLRGSPPRLTLPNYSHRFSLTTFSGGAMVFSNEDPGTPTLEVPTSPGGTIGRAAGGGGAKFSPSIILRPPPLPIKNLPRLPTVQGVGSFRRGEGSESGSRRPVREGSTGTVTANDKGKDTGRARLRSMPELLLTGPSRRGTMEEEQENSEDEDDLMGESEEDEDEDDHRPRTSEERAGTALSNYTASSYDDHDGYESSRSTEPTSGRPSMSSSYRGSALLAPPSTSPTRNRKKGRKTHSRSSSYNFDASSVEGSPENHRMSLGSDEQSLVSADGKGKGKEKSIIRDGRPLLTLNVSPTKSTQPRSPTLDLNLGDGLDLGYILAATGQAEQNILGDEPTITSKMKGFKGKGRMQEPEPHEEEEEDAIDTGKTPTASALGSGKSYYQDYFSSKEVPPLPADAPDIKGKQPQPATPRVGPTPSPAQTPRLDGTIRSSSKRFSAAIPPLPETGFVSRPSIYKHASRSMIDFHALAVKEERDKMVREEEERQEKEERARRRKSVRMSAMMLADDEPLQHAFMALGGGEAILEETSAPPSKRTSRVVERAADGVLARDRASIVGPRQNRMSMAPSYEAVLEALKAEGRNIQPHQLTGMPLRKRRSLPTFNANTEPPPYPSFLPRTNVPIEPRDDEGRERLPAYTNHIFMCGVVPRKMEFISAGNQARDRKWRKVVCVLEGTSFKVYKHRPHGGAIGEWWRSKKNMSSANLPTSVSREESRSNVISTNKLGERDEVQVVELKATGPVPDTPTSPVTPTRAQPRLTRYSPSASSTNIASSSSSRLATSPSGPSTRSRLGNLLRPHGRSQSEAANNLLTPARSPRPSLNLPSASSDSSGLASGQSFGESSQHLSVPGSSPSTRPTTPSSFMSHQRSPSRSDRRDSTSSIEDLPATETTIIGIGTVGGTGPLKPPAETGELIKEYSMQHAESGLGNDYIKRINVIRIRLEGEQFLIQANSTMEVVAWIEALQASANVALDLDERPMPKGPLFPRRRRRRRRPVAEADSAAANANHTPMMVDTT